MLYRLPTTLRSASIASFAQLAPSRQVFRGSELMTSYAVAAAFPKVSFVVICSKVASASYGALLFSHQYALFCFCM
jgi:hypothetical protein